MVGRLVQKEYVGFFIHQLAKANLGLLPTAKYTDLTFNMLGGKTTFGQCRTNLILGVGWKFGPDYLLILWFPSVQGLVRGYFSEEWFFRFH